MCCKKFVLLFMFLFSSISSAQVLRSDFFKSDTQALAILSGTNYSLAEFDELNPAPIGSLPHPGKIDTFAYKIINALLWVGYDFGYGKTYLDIYSQFKADNGLEANTQVSKDDLIKLDFLIYQLEEQENPEAQKLSSLTGFSYDIISSPPINNSLPRYHYAAQIHRALSALPNRIQKFDFVWGNYATFIGNMIKSSYPTTQVHDGRLYGQVLLSDCMNIETFFHEIGHNVDYGILKPLETTQKSPFGDTTYAGPIFFTDPSVGFYNISWVDYANFKYNGTTYSKDTSEPLKYGFVSSYATNHPVEDFAETFAMYLTQGRTFRYLAGSNPVLEEKYAWMKKNVFYGIEYDTGLTNFSKIRTDASYSHPYHYWPVAAPDYKTCSLDFPLVAGTLYDTTPPAESNGLPTGVISTQTINLSLNTDEAATCRYSTTPGVLYDSMTSPETEGSTLHTWRLSSLSDGSKTYYVRCIDFFGNVNSEDYPISFTVKSAQTSFCGNGACESGESSSNCCVDCPSNIGGGSTAYGTWYCPNLNSKARVVATSNYVCNNQTLAYGYVTVNTTETQVCGANTVCSGGECAMAQTSVCGNGVCESGESSSNCCLDCPSGTGDGSAAYGSWYCADSTTKARMVRTTYYFCNGQTKRNEPLTTNTTETRSCSSGQVCSGGNCILLTTQPPAGCGNGIIEAGETSDICCADVGCSSGFVCSNSTKKCVKQNKEISQETILDVLIRLEDARIKLDTLGDKARAISNYYGGKDQQKSDVWAKASKVFEDAKVKIDDIQTELKANKDPLDENTIDSVRQKLDGVRSSLKEAVDAILEVV